MSEIVGIVGAGTMGAGIAQVAVVHGATVRLLDIDRATAQRAIDGIVARLDRLVEKERLTPGERDAAVARLHAAEDPADLADASLVIEAVSEDLITKSLVLTTVLVHVSDDTIIATNTSSLSVSALGTQLGEAPRTVGMHFFNPAPLLQLVEVVAGRETRREVVDRVVAIAESWGKRVARAADVPGFIVNHVARPYYLEAFRILEDGILPADEIDGAMKRLGGFRMGPLELTDLIGQDVNTATTRSVWEQLDRPPLLRPCALQERLVADGHLGRKTGRGVYAYIGDAPAPALEVESRTLAHTPALVAALDDFMRKAAAGPGAERGMYDGYVFARILTALIAQALFALERGVAAKHDIDVALRYGTNYPKGPFEWLDLVGIDTFRQFSAALDKSIDDHRFHFPAALFATV